MTARINDVSPKLLLVEPVRFTAGNPGGKGCMTPGQGGGRRLVGKPLERGIHLQNDSVSTGLLALLLAVVGPW